MWEDTDCTETSAIQWSAKVMTVPDLSSEDIRDVGKRASVMECASPLALFPTYLAPAGIVPAETQSGLKSWTRISRIGFGRRLPGSLRPPRATAGSQIARRGSPTVSNSLGSPVARRLTPYA
jgi:hypothetical protein